MLTTSLCHGQMQQMMQKAMTAGRVYGKVIDAKTGKPVEFAAVQISSFKKDSIGMMKENIINGQLTQANGDFSLDQLPVMGGELTFKISAMGYKPYEQKVAFSVKMPGANGLQNGNWQQALNSIDKDLGNIKIEPNLIALNEVTIDGTLPALELRADKKVYNVDKNPIVTGGTAEDVLKNVPSVNVDIDGNVTMRNATPQIFIDGRPTTLTVDQIPADAIQEIEIITNPSAKYDASGGMAGILNIVLKKNRRIGYNGMVRTGVDTRGRINLGADLNVREGKINAFVSGNLNQRKSLGTGLTLRNNIGQEPLTRYTQNSTNKTNGYFGFLRSGVDVFLDNRNTITVSGNYVRGQFKPQDYLSNQTDTIFPDYISSGVSIRNSNSVRNFTNSGGTVAFKHLFPKEGKEITADVNFNSIKSDLTGNYQTQNYVSDFPTGLPIYQKQRIEGDNTFLTSQLDFVTPLAHKAKLEAGLRAAYRTYSSVNQNFLFNNDTQEYFLLPNLTANYKYIDQVYAAYTTFSQQLKKFNYQVGIRVESSVYTGELTQTGQQFKNNFPFSFFPSAAMTYKINDKNDLQFNYTRRINRPNFFQIIPYTDYSDSLNISKGNPGLKPEFTNSFELSLLKTFSRKNTLLGSVYFKQTDNVITRYLAYEQDSILNRTVLINTFENANFSYAYGAELTAQNNLFGWLDITANINAYQSVIDGKNIETNLTNKQFSWLAKLSFAFKLPKNFSFNVSGDYQSRTALQLGSGGGGRGMGGGMGGGGFGGGTQTTAQGYIRENYGIDAGLKYEFWKEKTGSLTLNVSDILKTRKMDSHSESPFYIQDSYRKRDAQIVRLTFSYRFGKFDTSLFKRKNTKINMDSLQDMGM
jgi:outer membrane receptor protein involved in Fe transport